MPSCVSPKSKPGTVNKWLIYLGHATIHHKVRAVDKAALVTGQEDHRVSLLNGLTKTARGEMHFTTESLRLVVTQPVLQERSAVIWSVWRGP